MILAYAAVPLLLATIPLGADPEDDSLGKVRSSVAWERFNDVSPGLKPIGRMRVREAKEIKGSGWSIGCETLDRDYADYHMYRPYLAELGAKRARFFSGWAKTERTKGVYDFAWLDPHIRETAAFGVKPWICLSYGNPVYGSDFRLGMKVREITDSPEAFAAWLRYCRACVRRYRDTVDEWEVWNEPFNQGEEYALLLIETARAIRAEQPRAKILVAAGRFPDDYVVVLERLKRESALDLVNLWAYHPYDPNPDRSYAESADPLRKLVKGYSSDYDIVQGEGGCPAQLEFSHALANIPWTECAQAKWCLRRWAGDAVRDIPSNHFTLIDLQYTFMLQSFGLIRSNALHDFVYRRPSWYAARNMFSFFDDGVRPVGLETLHRNGREVSLGRFEKDGRGLALVWYSDRLPDDALEFDRIDLSDALSPMEDALVCDMVTGKVYPLGRDGLHKIPVRDCPVLVSSRASVDFERFPLLTVEALQTFEKSALEPGLRRIGTVRPRGVREVGDSDWIIGCETLDRDFADFTSYCRYLAPLGIRTIRLQAGWAKCEHKRGEYDFRWLDEIVDFAIAEGLNPMLETGYGNPVYPGGGGVDLACGFPTSEEGLAAWDRWVDALTRHFKGRVRDWAMWNEPDIRPRDESPEKTPEQIAAFNVRTARIVKRNIPDARIGGLSLAQSDPNLVDRCLSAMGTDAALFDWIVYHGYENAPEASYANVERLRSVVARYNPRARLRQGENGCPSELTDRFALPGLIWDEVSQAKWDMRRMLGDLARDISSSVFTICDFNHRGLGMNRKGLIRADGDGVVIGFKRAYHAVRNVVSVFGGSVRANPSVRPGCSDPLVRVHAFKTDSGRTILAFWSAGLPPDYSRPGSEFKVRNVTLTCLDRMPEDPVWVDLMTGGVYELPSADVCISSDGLFSLRVPVYDSPCLIASRVDVLK